MNRRRMTCGWLVLLVVAAVSLAAGCEPGPDAAPVPAPPAAPQPAGEPPATGTSAGGDGKTHAAAEFWLEGWRSHLGSRYQNPLPFVFPYPTMRAGGIDSGPSACRVWPPDGMGLLLLDLQLLLMQSALEGVRVDEYSARDMLSRARDRYSHLPRDWVHMDFDEPVRLPVATGLSPSPRPGMLDVREVLFAQEQGSDSCIIAILKTSSEYPHVRAVRCPPGWLDQTQAMYFRNTLATGAPLAPAGLPQVDAAVDSRIAPSTVPFPSTLTIGDEAGTWSPAPAQWLGGDGLPTPYAYAAVLMLRVAVAARDEEAAGQAPPVPEGGRRLEASWPEALGADIERRPEALHFAEQLIAVARPGSTYAELYTKKPSGWDHYSTTVEAGWFAGTLDLIERASGRGGSAASADPTYGPRKMRIACPLPGTVLVTDTAAYPEPEPQEGWERVLLDPRARPSERKGDVVGPWFERRWVAEVLPSGGVTASRPSVDEPCDFDLHDAERIAAGYVEAHGGFPEGCGDARVSVMGRTELDVAQNKAGGSVAVGYWIEYPHIWHGLEVAGDRISLMLDQRGVWHYLRNWHILDEAVPRTTSITAEQAARAGCDKVYLALGVAEGAAVTAVRPAMYVGNINRRWERALPVWDIVVEDEAHIYVDALTGEVIGGN